MLRLSILIIVSLLLFTFIQAGSPGGPFKKVKKAVNHRVDAVKNRVNKEKIRFHNLKQQRKAQVHRQEILGNRFANTGNSTDPESTNTNDNKKERNEHRMAKKLKHKKDRRQLKHVLHKNPTKATEYHHHGSLSGKANQAGHSKPMRKHRPKHHHTLKDESKIKSDQMRAEKMHALKEKHDTIRQTHSTSAYHQRQEQMKTAQDKNAESVAGNGVPHHNEARHIDGFMASVHHIHTLHSKQPNRENDGHHKAPQNSD